MHKYILLLLLIGGCGSSSNNPTSPPVIAIVNASPDVVVGGRSWSQARLTAYIPVMQAQMHELAAAWGKRYDARIVQRTPQPGDIPLTFRTGADPACGAACHFQDNNGPVAEVFVMTGLNSGNDPLLEGEHEALEVTVDPQQNGTEVVDPVVCFTYCQGAPIPPGTLECGQNGTINTGNIVPDFVLPSWNGGKFPFDRMELLKAPKAHC